MDPKKGTVMLEGGAIQDEAPDKIVHQGVVHVPEGREVFPILKERKSQEAGTLSGGQQQMLAIGRGLMAKPHIMLLDEPSLGLSPLLVREIFTIIRRLNHEQNVTMMLVEQNAKVALDVAHYGYVLELGRIVMSGEGKKLQESQDIQEFYLGAQQETQRGQRRWKQRKTWR